MIRKLKNKIVPDLYRTGQTLPAIITDSLALIPGETITWQIWKAADLLAVEECHKNKGRILIASKERSKETDRGAINQIGVLADILSDKKASSGSHVVVIQSVERVLIQSVESQSGSLTARIAFI